MSHLLRFELNGEPAQAELQGDELLIELLREQLELHGTKEGCGKGECGACTVLVGDRPVNACLWPAMEIEGRSVTTIEGLGGPGGALGPVQRAFVEQGGIQCGFCSPGMILSTEALLRRRAAPSDAEIRAALRGNLCRCTGYVQIIAAVHRAAALRSNHATERAGEALAQETQP